MDTSKLTDAVKALRLALGDTQHMFANRMKTAIRTVARWETIRPPSGEVLVKFMRLADAHGYVDLATVFQQAISKELGHSVQRFSEDAIFEILPSERQEFEALAGILRSAAYKKEREEWQRICARVKGCHARSDANATALMGLTNEVRRRISAGESDADIVRGLPAWQPDIVAMFAKNLRELDRLSAASRKGEK